MPQTVVLLMQPKFEEKRSNLPNFKKNFFKNLITKRIYVQLTLSFFRESEPRLCSSLPYCVFPVSNNHHWCHK